MFLKRPSLSRIIKPACCAALISLVSLTALASRATGISPGHSFAPEPSGPLNAGARLVGMTGSGSNLRAKVEINLVSQSGSAEITVEDVADGRKDRRGTVLARAHVEKGRPHFLRIERDVVDGTDNHLMFRVRGKGDDGSTQEVNVYLLVPLDDSTAPTLVDEYLVYQGVQVTGGEQ